MRVNSVHYVAFFSKEDMYCKLVTHFFLFVFLPRLVVVYVEHFVCMAFSFFNLTLGPTTHSTLDIDAVLIIHVYCSLRAQC